MLARCFSQTRQQHLRYAGPISSPKGLTSKPGQLAHGITTLDLLLHALAAIGDADPQSDVALMETLKRKLRQELEQQVGGW
jgi:hypothetical protein